MLVRIPEGMDCRDGDLWYRGLVLKAKIIAATAWLLDGTRSGRLRTANAFRANLKAIDCKSRGK